MWRNDACIREMRYINGLCPNVHPTRFFAPDRSSRARGEKRGPRDSNDITNSLFQKTFLAASSLIKADKRVGFARQSTRRASP
jgi:hypothetical protein